jgi:peptidyl-prolyl cis-trans isomerase C
MPYFVNGQPVPEELVRQESERIARDLRWRDISDEAERARRIHAAAEQAAIDRVLVEQAAAGDPRPVDPNMVASEVQRLKGQWGCRAAFDDGQLRQWVERGFRVQRTTQEMVAGAAKPTAPQIEAFYNANRDHFRKPGACSTPRTSSSTSTATTPKAQARAGIEAALVELERGDPFAEVAERHSDCKGNGGDLGQFPAGHMVQEFEDAIRALEPGQRTGIFTTPFRLPHRGTAREDIRRARQLSKTCAPISSAS